MGWKAGQCKTSTPSGIFVTPSLEGWPTKAKEAPSPHEVIFKASILIFMAGFSSLKLVSAIFYQIFIFSPNDSPSKTMKCFLFHLKSSFHS